MEDKSIVDEPESQEFETIPKFPILIVKPSDSTQSIEKKSAEEPKILPEKIIESQESKKLYAQNLVIQQVQSSVQVSNTVTQCDAEENSEVNFLQDSDDDEDDDGSN